MSRWLTALCALGLLVLGGCDRHALMQRLIPEQQERVGRQLVDDLRAGRFSYIESHLSPAYRDEGTHARLEKARLLFPDETPRSVTTVGSNIKFAGGETTYNFTFEYQFSQRWLLAWVNFEESGGTREIVGFGVQPLADSIENTNAFRLTGKTPLHYAFLALAVLAGLFTLVTFVVCLFTPVPSYKWAWAIWVLVGVVQFGFNWTTGALGWHLISFQLLSVGFTQPLYGPLTLQFAIPLGAIMFWAKRGRWLRAARGLPPGDLRAG